MTVCHFDFFDNLDLQLTRCTLYGETLFVGLWAKQDLWNTLSAVFTYAKTIGLWNEAIPCEGVKVGRR
jgi:hypothetical protein